MAAELKKRTLTNLYNARPTWLQNAHARLDAALFAAYGWPSDLPDEEILENLLALNLERPGVRSIYRRGEVALSSIEKKRAQRLRFMNALYEVVDGLEGQFADKNALLTELGYDFDKEEHFNEFQSIAGYLKGEGLITTIHTKDRGAIMVGLTHKGVREVEAARSRPDKPTEHFPPANNISVQYMIGSQIQQGSPGATQSLTVVSQSDIEGLEAFINSLKQSVDQLELDEDQRAELEADIQTIEAQIASPKPKQEVLRPGLESIGRVLEGSASAAVASPLTATVTALIGNFIQGQ